MILFIDTHDTLITVALKNEDELFIKTKESEYSHSIYTMPLIESLFKENNLDVKDLKKIIVVNGPGSFTGIRIGLTVAKTISYSLNIPIYTISSLKAYLVSSKLDNKMCVIEDSKGYYIGTNSFEIYTDSLDNYKEYNKVENKLNILKIMEYINTLKPVNVHGVKANYVKVIEALK